VILTAIAIWAAGMPIAYRMDRDPTGTRRDRMHDAAAWPLLLLIIAGIGAAWAVGKAGTRLRRMIAC
jgi:hypothetical protein